MNLKSLYINGFGKFHDWHLGDFHPRMMIFLGPNEAGKSTIMHFIRRIMFGFPDKRTNENPYPPLDGGKHGGNLTFVKTDGTYTIERYASEKNNLKMIFPDGSAHTVQNVLPLVGSVTSQVFNNIFAFGLEELQSFESLNSESIKDQLYSAGKGLGHLSLRDFQRSLDKRLGDLYKDKGSHPEINKLFHSITDVSRKLHDIESESNRYKELQNELETVNRDVERKENEKKDYKQQEQHANNLLASWNDYRQIQEIKEQLAEIPFVEKFPENGIVLMEKELEKQESLETGMRNKQEQLERIKRVMEGLTIQEALFENQTLILELQKRQQQYTQALEDLPLIRTQKERETEELNQLLREIGSNWNAENFEQIDNTLPNKEKVKQFQIQFESLHQLKQEKEQARELSDKDLNNVIRDKTDNDAVLQTISPDFESLEQTMELRKGMSYLEEILSSYEEKKKEYTALLEKEVMLNRMKPSHRSAFYLYPPMQFVLYGLFGVILGGCLYSIIFKNTVMAWFLGLIYLPVLLLLLSYHKQKHSNKDTVESDQNGEFFTTRKIALERELEELESTIQKTFRWVGFQSLPSKTAIISQREMIQDNLMKWNKKQELEIRLRRIQTRIEEIENEKKCIEDEMMHLDDAIKQNTEAWNAFLALNKLDSALTPASVFTVFNVLDTALEKKKSIRNLQGRIHAMQETVKCFQDKMSHLLEAIGQDQEKGDWVPVLERIVSALHDSNKNEAERRTKLTEERAMMEELKAMNHDLQKVRVIIQALLDQAGASDEQVFRTNGEAYHRRNALQLQQVQCSNQIKRLSGEGAKYDALIMELQDSSYESLNQSKSNLEEALKQCEESISQLREHKGRITKEIEQIEKKEESSALRLDKAVFIEKANLLAREWATLVLAKSIMKKAIEEYEREKQPNVIKEAQHYFSLMTLGAYPSIYSPLNEDVLYVEDRNKVRKDIKDLSKGTAEQLYLSLRFGFIQEFTANNESLPVIMDDILVNFDPKRFDACCEAFQLLSADHQILYFTCHPDSAMKMNRFISDSAILTLP